MYLIKEAKLIERIDSDYIKKVHSDMLVFLKNIKRIKTPEQYQELVFLWLDWVTKELEVKIGKNLFGLNTLRASDGDLMKSFNSFEEWAILALYPSDLDIKKAIKRGDISWNADSYLDFIKELAQKGVADNYHKQQWLKAYTVFKNVQDSKYVSLKANIDKYFYFLQNLLSEIGSQDEKFVQDVIQVEGIPVEIEYSEDIHRKASSPYHVEHDFIYKAVDDLKKAFKFIRDAKFSKAIQNSKFKLSTVSTDANNKNIHNGQDYGTGAYFAVVDDKTTLLKGRLATYSSMSTIETIIHESGHRFYFKNMSNEQRTDWSNFYGFLKSGSSPYSKRINHDLFEFLNDQYEILSKVLKGDNNGVERFATIPTYINWLWKNISENYEDLLIMAKENGSNLLSDLNELGKIVNKSNLASPLIQINIVHDSLIELLNKLSDKDFKKSQSKALVTTYGSVNASEFFAETFAAYCLRNTKSGKEDYSLLENVFAKFIEITGVRSAWHEKVNVTKN